MSATKRVQRAQTGALLAYPILSHGGPGVPDGVDLTQPSSATVRIRTASTPLPDSATAVTVDSLSGTLTSAAAEGATSLALTGAVTLVRGRQYVVTTTTGERFVVESRASGSSSTVRLAEPLPMAAAASSTIHGFALTTTLSTAQTSDIGEGLALWAVTYSSSVYAFTTQFRVVERIPRSTLTATALTRGYPIVHTIRSRLDGGLDELLQTVWDDALLPALEARGIRAELVIDPSRLEGVHAAMAVHHLLMLDPSKESAFRDEWKTIATQRFETALASREFWVDGEDEGAAPRDESAPPAAYRQTRWVR